MPLSFLSPGLLAGLAAAAIPVIIHFLSRRRSRRIAFSDLRFLHAEEAHQARRRGVRRWLLLALRVLIILCLVLAAARPHWGGLPGSAGRATLFVLDASASMQTQQDDGARRFDAAVALIGEMIEALPSGASVQILQAGPTAIPLFATWLPAGPAARAALAGTAATDGALDRSAAWRQAANLAAGAPSSPIDVVLVSDLQAVGGPDDEAAVAALAATGARVLIRRMDGGVPAGAVLDVGLPARALQPGETIAVAATVVPDRPEQEVWLEIDGRRVAEAVVPAGSAVGSPIEVPLSLTVPRAGLHAGVVGKEPDRLPLDDRRPFAIDVPRRLDVLIAHGPDRDGIGRGGWRYLARALDPETAASGPFAVRAVAADSLATVGLGGVEVLVVVDVGAPGRRFSALLRPWMESGGALLVLAGEPGQERDLRTGWLPLLGLPGDATLRTRPAEQAEGAHVVDPGHPVLAGLGSEALEALAAARWRRYFEVDEGRAPVLLAADGGAPLLMEGRIGRGRWALAPFHLRRDATDLMLNPVFLPVVRRLAARLASSGGHAVDQLVDDPPVLPVSPERLGLRPGDSVTDLAVLVPPDGAERAADLQWRPSGALVAAPPTLRAGHYAFTARGDTIGLVAAAVPPAESSPTVDDATAVAARLEAAGLPRAVDLGQADAAGLVRTLEGHGLARWLLLAALFLMALEVWVGRRAG